MATIAAHSLGEQVGPTLTTFTDYCTNFLFDCLLQLPGHTLFSIIKQGKIVISWCVSVWARFLKKKNYIYMTLYNRKTIAAKKGR